MLRRSIFATVTLSLLVAGCGSDKERAEPDVSIVAFKASPDSVSPGDRVTLTWTTENAAELHFFAGAEPLSVLVDDPASGTAEVRVRETTTFRLEAVGANASKAMEQTTVNVEPFDEVVIESFAASASEVGFGGIVTLSWRTSGATSLSLRDSEGRSFSLSGLNPAEGSVEVRPSGYTTYELVATGPGGEANATANVGVVAPAGARLRAESTRITIGESTVLRWEAVRATEVALVEGANRMTVEPVGEKQVTPSATTKYILEANGPGGPEAVTVTVEVAPSIDSFVAIAPGPSRPGTEVELRWSIRGATNATLSNLDGFVYTIPAGDLASGHKIAPAGVGGAFVLVAASGIAETTARASVPMSFEPRVELSIDPPAGVVAGDGTLATVTLSWRIDGASRIQVKAVPGGNVNVAGLSPRQDSIDIDIAGPTTFHVTAFGDTGKTEADISPVVHPPEN
ncbi:hypothetical protein [Vulgatibacter incomptus]|nr:hypothetical protein [Vulgatibacter incomptus]